MYNVNTLNILTDLKGQKEIMLSAIRMIFWETFYGQETYIVLRPCNLGRTASVSGISVSANDKHIRI